MKESNIRKRKDETQSNILGVPVSFRQIQSFRNSYNHKYGDGRGIPLPLEAEKYLKFRKLVTTNVGGSHGSGRMTSRKTGTPPPPAMTTFLATCAFPQSSLHTITEPGPRTLGEDIT